MNFSAALDPEDKVKDRSISDDEDEDGDHKKISAAQYQLFRQAVTTSKGSFKVNPAKTRRVSWASLLDLGDSEVADRVSWLDLPSLKDMMAFSARITQGLKEDEEVEKTTLSETLNTASSTFKHLTVKQIFPREPYRLKVHLDISKCFDSINHIILLKKLEMYGFIGTELDWFSSYLNGCKQFVNFDNETSKSCEITCGVPQGSVLGPILFLLFINDISNFAVEGCVSNMYAADVIIYTSTMSTHELECKLQSCIDSISNWYGMNKLCINKKKSSVMVIGSKFQLLSLNLDDFAISINVDKLQLVEQPKYLGLWVRNDLSWDDHIIELCKKMYYYVHMFRRLRKILPSQLLLNIYKSYVQSKIDYGLSIWGCTTEANLDRI